MKDGCRFSNWRKSTRCCLVAAASASPVAPPLARNPPHGAASPTDRDREFPDLAYLVWEMDVAVPVTPETVLHARVRLRDCIRHCGRRTGNVPLRHQHFKRSFFPLPQITYHSANSRIKLLSLRCVVNFICLLLLPVHRIHLLDGESSVFKPFAA